MIHLVVQNIHTQTHGDVISQISYSHFPSSGHQLINHNMGTSLNLTAITNYYKIMGDRLLDLKKAEKFRKLFYDAEQPQRCEKPTAS